MKTIGLIAILVAMLWLVPTAQGADFECAFIQDKYATGKPNQASCSMFPEKVYSTKWYTPKKHEHCDVREVYRFEDLIDIRVDTERKTVVWTRHSGLTDEAKPQHKTYFIKEQGYSRQKAEQAVASESKDQESFVIDVYYPSLRRIYVDPVTRELLKPPRDVPEHTFILSNHTYRYYLYIPEPSGHAILLEPSGGVDGEHSWMGMRFGKCRKLR